MQSALSKALMGKENISGRLPISIPGMFDIGSGIFLEKKFNQEEKKQFNPGKLMLRVRPQSVDANISNIEKLMDQAVNERAWPGGVLLAANTIFFYSFIKKVIQ